MKRVLALFLLQAVMCMQPARSDEISDYYSKLHKNLEREHWIPILIPRGEKVGNVYDVHTLQFLADNKTCFPKLSPPAPQESAVPSLTISSNVNGALAAGLTNVATAEAQLGSADSVVMEYEDVTVVSMPALTLAGLFDPKRCKFLEAQVDATRNGKPYSGQASYLVLGEVMSARRNIKLNYRDSGKAQIELTNWQKFLRLAGITASARIEGGADTTVVVTARHLPA